MKSKLKKRLKLIFCNIEFVVMIILFIVTIIFLYIRWNTPFEEDIALAIAALLSSFATGISINRWVEHMRYKSMQEWWDRH